MYTVKLQDFQGPLDLLLQLIEEQTLDITEVSLAQITDQYIGYIKTIDIKPADLANFLVIASQLLLIKSKAILPTLELSPEEGEGIEDLKRKLEEYKKFRLFADELKKIERKKHISYSRDFYAGIDSIFYPPKNITSNILYQFFKKIMGGLPQEEILPKASIQTVVSIEEKINWIKDNLLKRIEQSFDELTKNNSRVELIVSFLALLELVKQRIVAANQKGLFNEIKIRQI